MQKKAVYFLIFAFLFSSLSYAHAIDKDEAYKKIMAHYGNMKSISVSFNSQQNSKLTGNLKAKKGNKYQIELGDRIIVSNGKIIWNYSRSQKNVNISIFEKGKGGFSLERFFFEFLSEYKPESMSAETNSKGRQSYMLVVKPAKKVSDMPDQIKIWVSKTDFKIISVASDIGHGVEVFDLSSLTVNPALKDKTFEFKVPKGTEIIDLR